MTKFSLEKYFGVLAFEVLVFDFLKSFISCIFNALSHSALANNQEIDGKSPHFGKNGWGFQPYGKMWTGQWPKLLNSCTVIFLEFLDAVIRQFLSKEQLLQNCGRKQSFP